MSKRRIKNPSRITFRVTELDTFEIKSPNVFMFYLVFNYLSFVALCDFFVALCEITLCKNKNYYTEIHKEVTKYHKGWL